MELQKWANYEQKDYIFRRYAVIETRFKKLGEVLRLMKRTQNDLQDDQVLSGIEHYSNASDLLDDYDHQTMKLWKGTKSAYVLSYEEYY